MLLPKSITLGIAGISILLLAACSSATPLPSDETATGSASAIEQTSEMPSALSRLLSLGLPSEWQKSVIDGWVWFSVNQNGADPRTLLQGVFFAVPLGSVQCDASFARSEVLLNFGEQYPASAEPTPVIINGSSVGYQWPAYGGVAGGAPPNRRDWCIHTKNAGYDLHLSAFVADALTVDFVEQTFIPLWID